MGSPPVMRGRKKFRVAAAQMMIRKSKTLRTT